MPNEKITCMGCDKEFQLLLSHLERTKSCQDFYDMSAMRKEAERLIKEKKAQRSRESYNDPDESPKKRAAAKEYYREHTLEKKEAMEAYRNEHREDINKARKEKYNQTQIFLTPRSRTLSYFECPICDEIFYGKKSIDSHIKDSHSENQPSSTCQICDKTFGYKKENLERHMTEVHSGVKHGCDECPAAFTRKSALEKHMRDGWHYLSFYCKQCKKTLVFKSLGGLIEHTIVKQSEGEHIGTDGTKWKMYKSGILVTCKSQVESTQLKEGEHVLCMPRKDKVKAETNWCMKKEEIINEGLLLVKGNPEALQVKLDLDYKRHEEDGRKRSCKWCNENIPYSNEYCTSRKPNENWQLLRS